MSRSTPPKDRVSRRGFISGLAVGGVGAAVGREALAQEFIETGLTLDDLEGNWWETDDSTDTGEPGTTTNPQPPVDPQPPEPASAFAVRRDIYTLPEGGTAIQSLRRGIAVMRQRSIQNPADPRGWLFQANIHGGRAGAQIQECEHGSRFFLSWHRMYLFFFERILREASGDPTLTLPYWDYSVPGRASLPPATRFPANEQQNPLYWSDRNAYYNNGNPLPTQITDTEGALRTMGFDGGTGFNRTLEQRPHNGVHVQIGGTMLDPLIAAQDPIFWLHHCNIDRQWNRWVARGGSRRTPNDLGFLSQRFNFYDETATLVAMTGEQVFDTTSTLAYRYDDDAPPPVGMDTILMAAAAPPPPQVPQTFRTVTRTLPNGDTVMERVETAPVALAMVSAEPVSRPPVALAVAPRALRLGGGSTKLRLNATFARPQRTIQRRVVSQPVGNTANVPQTFRMITERVSEPSPEMFVTAMDAPEAKPVVLQLQDIDFEKSPGVFNIFVNLPDGTPPDPSGPYYASYFAPFAQNKTSEPESFDITSLLNRQIEQGLWDGGEIDVQFIAIDPAGQVTTVIRNPVTIGQVRIIRE